MVNIIKVRNNSLILNFFQHKGSKLDFLIRNMNYLKLRNALMRAAVQRGKGEFSILLDKLFYSVQVVDT